MILVAIDVETTGLDPHVDEVWNAAFVILNQDFKPTDQRLDVKIIADLSRIDWELPIFANNKEHMENALRNGLTRPEARTVINWWLHGAAGGGKLMPVGHNYGFDRSFIRPLIGTRNYESIFHHHYHDSAILAEALNEAYRIKYKQSLFPNGLGLSQLAKTFGINPGQSHTAMDDAVTAAAVYQSMLQTIHFIHEVNNA